MNLIGCAGLPREAFIIRDVDSSIVVGNDISLRKRILEDELLIVDSFVKFILMHCIIERKEDKI